MEHAIKGMSLCSPVLHADIARNCARHRLKWTLVADHHLREERLGRLTGLIRMVDRIPQDSVYWPDRSPRSSLMHVVDGIFLSYSVSMTLETFLVTVAAADSQNIGIDSSRS